MESFFTHDIALGEAQLVPPDGSSPTSLVQNAAAASRGGGADFSTAGEGSLQMPSATSGESVAQAAEGVSRQAPPQSPVTRAHVTPSRARSKEHTIPSRYLMRPRSSLGQYA